MVRLTIELDRAEYEALLHVARNRTGAGHDDRQGPSIEMLDLRSAVRKLEAADRPLKVVR